jgi:hypothetical protein
MYLFINTHLNYVLYKIAQLNITSVFVPFMYLPDLLLSPATSLCLYFYTS